MTAVTELERFGEQWIRSCEDIAAAIKEKNLGILRDQITLNGAKGGGNSVNRKGYGHLRNAVLLILSDEGLTRRLSHSTMEQFVVEEFFVEISRASNPKKKFSMSAVVARAKSRVSKVRWATGLYVYPVLFAPHAQSSDFRIGPARIVSKSVFMDEQRASLQEADAANTFGVRSFKQDWERYTERYDHFIVVEMAQFEMELAWDVGREVAEFCLNLVRMVFGFYHTEHIKLSGGFIWDEAATKLTILDHAGISFSSSRGPWGSHLADDWPVHLTARLAFISGTLASLSAMLASGEFAGNPILERQRYAHQLISEAYCEPHDHIRLVRLVSALEALSVLEKADKAQTLAMYCAQAGGFSDSGLAMEIHAAVMAVYNVRNKIVHGDGASSEEIRRVFFGIEKYLLFIVEGYTCLYVSIWKTANPKHLSHLRKEVKKRLEMFFWAPELAFNEC